MKIYLQDCKTLKFIRCDSSWSSDINEALDFISVRRAVVYGLTELKEAFQLLQVETDGLQSLCALIPQMPVIRVAKAPGRATRLAGAAGELVRRVKAWRGPAQILPAIHFPTTELLRIPEDGGHKI